ncbi:hypothetical protein IQ241_07855 [Romeria aff. gracilis LEGE 07310]|uniref:Uncharacterized protein n=1 Tax=Vasconcelosia minhoensis LEGE 07310 TaxID=915328 RepID=A0A8J7AUS4_9CYAN|nr:hypothetical protein [Romeria gracilis]MBE9077208.1 hypothetical protein [Romeria aff. gracilis LEGE 07310]
MTPEAIRQLSQIRDEFNTLFSAAIGLPVSITKGSSHSSNAAKIAWEDRHHRQNYICLYACIAPDELLPDRPLILRLGVNKGLGVEAARRGKKSQQTSQKPLRFELTLLPDEVLKVVPWVISLLQSYDQGSSLDIAPPCRLNFDTLDQLVRQGAWTQRAACRTQAHASQALENVDFELTDERLTNG